MLPKIQKHISNTPGWPAISDNETPTEDVSSFFDFHLKTIIPTIHHNLEDTRDFSSQLNQPGNIQDDPLLIMFDNVQRTYRYQGLKKMRRYLDK